MKSRSIRGKLLIAFFVLILIILLITFTDVWFRGKERGLNNTLSKIEQINIDLQVAQGLELAYFNDETINEIYFEGGVSSILIDRDTIVQNIQANLKDLRQDYRLDIPQITQPLGSLMVSFEEHEKIFNGLVNLIFRRGFKDYGVEGEMRKYIHEVETTGGYEDVYIVDAANSGYDRVLLLSIRRHEKDFIIRKDEKYIVKLQEKVAILKRVVIDNPVLVQKLNQYEKAFMDLVDLERQIGYTDEDGKRKELVTQTTKVDNNLSVVSLAIQNRVAELQLQNNIIQFSIVGLAILIAILQTFFVSRAIGQPIRELSTSINRVIESKFSQEEKITEFGTHDEIGKLSKDMNYLVDTVHKSIQEIKNKSEEAEKRQLALMDSISYAERMQTSTLRDQQFAHLFERYFIIYRPKFEVSGDFYWVKIMEDGTSFCALVDCKGIGLAASIMTMIANTLLNQIVISDKKDDPAEILELLDKEFKRALPQGYMRIGLCKIEQHPEKSDWKNLTFASANLSIFHSKGIKLMELPVTPRNIGGKTGAVEPFTNLEISLNENDFVYFSTDGFMKQVNENDLEVGRAFLKEIVEESIYRPTGEQQISLEAEIDKLISNGKQVDDITLVVLKLCYEKELKDRILKEKLVVNQLA